jgi:hypothetical protein
MILSRLDPDIGRVPAKARKLGNKILGLPKRWDVIHVQDRTLPKGNNKRKINQT